MVPSKILLVLLVAMISAAEVGPAHANLRDTVMSRAFACGVIGDSRQWLDCFYGSAQPLRAALGLPAVPQNQFALAANPPAGQVTNMEAESRENILYSVVNCRSLGNDRDWLNCFYAAARVMRERLGLDVAKNDRTDSAVPREGDVGSPFGLRTSARGDSLSGPIPAPVPSKRISGLESQMASYAFGPDGYFTVVLANGQIWRQISGDTSYAHWKGTAGKYSVRISHGFLGSFNLTVKNTGGMFKVERIK